uniref:Ribosome biogenesis protein NSA2 homolog n=1 Tax=Nannospalax galili TaxID=1026970 RepID=A0A8C6R0L8_NANGA
MEKQTRTHRKHYGYEKEKESHKAHERSKKAKTMIGLKAKPYHTQHHTPQGVMPAYLLDREELSRAKVLSNMIKQKRKEKAGKWEVPLPKVRAQGETEVLKVIRTGKREKKAWKRMVTKVCFGSDGFMRKPPKYETFIRPMGLRLKNAHVTHPELKATICLFGVIMKGTVTEVNMSELGLVTQGGKVMWGKYAQVTHNAVNDGCINAVLLT